MVLRIVLVLLPLVAIAATASADDQRAREALTKKLAEFKGTEGGQIVPVSDAAVARAFPAHSFYVLRFRQYPVALAPPEPLTANNLFVAKPDSSVDHLRDPGALETFFRATLAPVKAEAEAKDAAVAWLRLTQEFHQDGFAEFVVPLDAVRLSASGTRSLQVMGKAVVKPRSGDAGEIDARLTFDAAGKLVRVSETANLKRGIRPICQATKLLDPDPVVRRMAEQDLLVMGKAARDYLAAQRAKADPKLQRAIDRLWERILAEDR